MKKLVLYFFLLKFVFFLYAQWIPNEKEKEEIANNLMYMVSCLAHDSLQGREAGTINEIKSRDIIVNQFKKIGLTPYFNDSYYDKFVIDKSYEYTSQSYIEIGEEKFFLNTDFFILSKYFIYDNLDSRIISVGNGLVKADKQIDDYKKLDYNQTNRAVLLIDINYPEKYDFISQDNYYETILKSLQIARLKGARAVVLYESKNIGSNKNLKFDKDLLLNYSNLYSDLPIFYIKKNFKTFKPREQRDFKTFLKKESKDIYSYNIAGFLNNNKPTTIVIGAHYDHIGYKGEAPLPENIYNGADDNASGTSMMLQLAKFIKQKKLKNHNYLFVAFGAEEQGLLGSKKFVETISSKNQKVIAMINLDMVGRLCKETRILNIIGVGSSEEWENLLNQTYNPNLFLNKKNYISGGSDHISFYKKNIPVLFFITGLHKDYHKPTDDTEYINKNGFTDVFIFLANLIMKIDSLENITFKQTEYVYWDFSIYQKNIFLLNIEPDLTFNGKGLRVKKILNKSNELEEEDVILKINEVEIKNFYDYVNELLKIKNEDEIKVTILRNNVENVISIKNE